MDIEFYKENGPLGFLANYSDHGFTKNGIYYKTAEHYYQSEKFTDKKIKEKIINAKTPKEASTIGRDRNLTRKENFKDIKLEVMYQGVLEKFRQNPLIRAKLIETGNKRIKEMTVKESFWGVGPNKDGKNHSGHILEVVREKVKEETINRIIKNCLGKKVYVIGHSKPDADSVFSSLLLTHILKNFNIDAIFAIRDENFIEKELIKDYLKEDYEIINDYKDKYFILVDCNSIEPFNKENILGAFDHHRITGEIDDLIEIEYASTSLLLYDLFKNTYNFNSEEKLYIALSTLTDTEYLISKRYKEEDKILYESLKVNLDNKKLQKKYFKTTDFNLEISENLQNNYKEYQIDRKKIKRSIISSYTKEKEKYYTSYIEKLNENNINLLIWCDYEKAKTYIHYNNHNLTYNSFTTSTYLIIDYLQKEGYLK